MSHTIPSFNDIVNIVYRICQISSCYNCYMMHHITHTNKNSYSMLVIPPMYFYIASGAHCLRNNYRVTHSFVSSWQTTHIIQDTMSRGSRAPHEPADRRKRNQNDVRKRNQNDVRRHCGRWMTTLSNPIDKGPLFLGKSFSHIFHLIIYTIAARSVLYFVISVQRITIPRHHNNNNNMTTTIQQLTRALMTSQQQ